MLVKMGIFPKFRGEHKKLLKPPPSVFFGWGNVAIFRLLKDNAHHDSRKPRKTSGCLFWGPPSLKDTHTVCQNPITYPRKLTNDNRTTTMNEDASPIKIYGFPLSC